MRGTRLTALLAVAAIALGACTAAGRAPGSAAPTEPPATAAPTPAPTPTPSPTQPPDTVLYRMDYVGGFVMPTYLVTRLPSLVVYADGRVFEQGVVTMQYPGQLLAPVLVSQLTPAGIAAVEAQIAKSGFTADVSYAAFGVADAADAKVTMLVNGKPVVVTVGPASQTDGMTAKEKADRASFDALVAAMTDLRTTAGAGNMSASAPYTPERALLYLAIGPLAEDPLRPAQPLTWPLTTAIEAWGSPVSNVNTMLTQTATCGLLEGKDVTAMWPVLQAANQLSYFKDAKGATYAPLVRMLLPGEALACGEMP